MKTPSSTGCSKNAFTLLEMSIVIMVLLALVSIGLFSSRKMDEWKLARQASETLRSVYSAQRMFLADNPTVSVATITEAQLIDYLPNMAQTTPKPASLKLALPEVKSITGAVLGFRATVSPPILIDGSGARYDPSGPSTDPKTYKDGLWDVGE